MAIVMNCARCGKTLTALSKYEELAEGVVLCEDCALELHADEGTVPDLQDPDEMHYITALGKRLPVRILYANPIEFCLACTVSVNGSDCHIKTNSCPSIRKGGSLYWCAKQKISSNNVADFMKKYRPSFDLTQTTQTDDFAFNFKDDGDQRFRCNVFHDRNGWCLDLRLLNFPSVDFDILGIPHILKNLAENKSGLILITGPTGSGKSTTLAALIDFLNNNRNLHIVTLEDPIEFVHESNNCLISQREIGTDAQDFQRGVIDALREDPDIIMIGEMRDYESMAAALRAAETGHLVLATMHTRNASSTITRIVDSFPAGQQNQIRQQMAMSLIGIICQQLIPDIKQPGKRHLATEVCLCNSAVRANIREDKLHQLTNILQTNGLAGMHTMNHCLQQFVDDGKISQQSYEQYSIN